VVKDTRSEATLGTLSLSEHVTYFEVVVRPGIAISEHDRVDLQSVRVRRAVCIRAVNGPCRRARRGQNVVVGSVGFSWWDRGQDNLVRPGNEIAEAVRTVAGRCGLGDQIPVRIVERHDDVDLARVGLIEACPRVLVRLEKGFGHGPGDTRG